MKQQCQAIRNGIRDEGWMMIGSKARSGRIPDALGPNEKCLRSPFSHGMWGSKMCETRFRRVATLTHALQEGRAM